MGPVRVVADAPGLDRPPRVLQIQEPVLIQALLAQPSVEALDEGVLYRLARPDELELHTPQMRPLIQGPARKLRPVIYANRSRKPTVPGHTVQDLRHSSSRQRKVKLNHRGFPRVVIHYRQ